MKNKKLTISSLAASLLLGLAMTSFAGVGITSKNLAYDCCADQTTSACTSPVKAPDLTYQIDG